MSSFYTTCTSSSPVFALIDLDLDVDALPSSAAARTTRKRLHLLMAACHVSSTTAETNNVVSAAASSLSRASSTVSSDNSSIDQASATSATTADLELATIATPADHPAVRSKITRMPRNRRDSSMARKSSSAEEPDQVSPQTGTRSSGRARKATAKRQALSGTKFFPTDEWMTSPNGANGIISPSRSPSPDPIAKPTTKESRRSRTASVTKVTPHSSPVTENVTADIVDSQNTDTSESAPVDRSKAVEEFQPRLSRRERKPTAKAIDADTEIDETLSPTTRKRSASPIDEEPAAKTRRASHRPVKIPSKLRYSASFDQDDDPVAVEPEHTPRRSPKTTRKAALPAKEDRKKQSLSPLPLESVSEPSPVVSKEQKTYIITLNYGPGKPETATSRKSVTKPPKASQEQTMKKARAVSPKSSRSTARQGSRKQAVPTHTEPFAPSPSPYQSLPAPTDEPQPAKPQPTELQPTEPRPVLTRHSSTSTTCNLSCYPPHRRIYITAKIFYKEGLCDEDEEPTNLSEKLHRLAKEKGYCQCDKPTHAHGDVAIPEDGVRNSEGNAVLEHPPKDPELHLPLEVERSDKFPAVNTIIPASQGRRVSTFYSLLTDSNPSPAPQPPMPRSQSLPQPGRLPPQHQPEPPPSYYASPTYMTQSVPVRQTSYPQVTPEPYQKPMRQNSYPQARHPHHENLQQQNHRSLDQLREEAKGRGIVHSYETSYEDLKMMLESSYARQRMMASHAHEQARSPVTYPQESSYQQQNRRPSFGPSSASQSPSLRALTPQAMRPPPIPQMPAARQSMSQSPLPSPQIQQSHLSRGTAPTIPMVQTNGTTIEHGQTNSAFGASPSPMSPGFMAVNQAHASMQPASPGPRTASAAYANRKLKVDDEDAQARPKSRGAKRPKSSGSVSSKNSDAFVTVN